MRLLTSLILLAALCGCISAPPEETTTDLWQSTTTIFPEPTTTESQRAPTTTVKAEPTTTTDAPASSTTTTLPETTHIACVKDGDCGEEANTSSHCDSTNGVVIAVTTPRCENPGTNQSKCASATVNRRYETCKEVCSGGKCYPQTCNNGWFDRNEEYIDCGGICPPCPATNETMQYPEKKTCILNGVCEYEWRGKSRETYNCYNGNVVVERQNVTCNLTGCTWVMDRKPYEECTNGHICVPGEKRCKSPGTPVIIRQLNGTCYDCTKNQDETGIDCGGVCDFCAPKPETESKDFDVYTTIELPNTLRVVEYKGYEFKFIRPIESKTELGTCTNGAVLQVKRPNNELVQHNVTRYRNNFVDNMVFGFESADEDSAEIWASELKYY